MHSGLGSEIIKKKKKNLCLSLSAFTFGPLTAEHKRNIELSSWQHPECQHRVLQMVSCAISRAKKTYWSLVFCSWLTEVFKCTLVFSCVPLTRNPWQSVQSFEYNIFFYILYRAQLYNLLQLYSAFLGTQSALHSKGDISSSTTSVQHPPGWCDGSHSAPERPPHTNLLVERRQSDEANQ